MRPRTIVSVLVLVGAALGAPAANGVAPQEKWAIVNFAYPTKVSTEILVGPYLVVHDDGNMLRGEPCTSLYPVQNHAGWQAAVSFHCVPRARPVVERLTITTEWDDAAGMRILTEYQFAGDAEGHGVPIILQAAHRLPVRARDACVR